MPGGHAGTTLPSVSDGAGWGDDAGLASDGSFTGAAEMKSAGSSPLRKNERGDPECSGDALDGDFELGLLKAVPCWVAVRRGLRCGAALGSSMARGPGPPPLPSAEAHIT